MEEGLPKLELFLLKKILTDLKMSVSSAVDRKEKLVQKLKEAEKKKLVSESKLEKLLEMKGQLETRVASMKRELETEFENLNTSKREIEELKQLSLEVKRVHTLSLQVEESVAITRQRGNRARDALNAATAKHNEIQKSFEEMQKAYQETFNKYERCLTEGLSGMEKRREEMASVVKIFEESCDDLQKVSATKFQ